MIHALMIFVVETINVYQPSTVVQDASNPVITSSTVYLLEMIMAFL